MRRYVLRRLLGMIPTLAVISVLVFIVIQLPEGDIVTSTLDRLSATGVEMSDDRIRNLRAQYNLDQPLPVQYLSWIGNFITGDMGFSYLYARPVNELVWERLGYTLLVTVGALLFTWLLALPIGIYSAVRQYSIADYAFTTAGLIGLATPNFLIALILMYLGYTWFGLSFGGLFSPEFLNAPWSWARFLDLLAHLWIPVIVIGTSGMAVTMRLMRANLLDELRKPYVTTARAKGVPPLKLLLKYPVRIAINPFISTIGLLLPALISGEAIVGVVLNLPTTGPLLVQSLITQDMYLAGSLIMLLSVLTVTGMLLSDLLLAWVDPRIRYERA
ncbi:MAG: ABC transporter permease [Gammaproteobacteria bacterium]|nr:ABC transporter permease [Gammaproteobacteria bacterium]